MRPPWLFVLVFLAYLVGPAPARRDPREATPLAAASSVPFQRLIAALYPTAEATDQARWAGRVAGASFTAAAVAATFEALRTLASGPRALLLALLAGFASPLWSWASRSDTIEAPATLSIALLLWLGLRPAKGGLAARATDLASGALAVLAWSLDPDLGLATACAVLVGVRSRPWTSRSALAAAAGAGAAVSLAGWLRAPSLAEAFPPLAELDATVAAAHFVSPARGLFLFAPLAFFALASLLRRGTRERAVLASGLAILLAMAHRAALEDPWGPQSFGPAVLSPLIPLLAVMAARLPAVGLRWGSLAALPVLLFHAAAVVEAGFGWDRRREPTAHPEAVWDLRDSPFSDLIRGAPLPDPASFAPKALAMPPGEHATHLGEPLPWLAYGWESPEPNGTWAAGRETWITLAVPPGDYILTLVAAAPRFQERGQRLEIERPGGPRLEVAFTGGRWDFQPVAIPFRPEAGVTVLRIRPAQTWRPGRGDVRRLSFFVASLRLQRVAPGQAGFTDSRSRR